MRRKDREVSADAAWQILTEAHTCHLGMISQGRPYVVPLSHAVIDQRVYFHWAKAGEKLDAIMADPRVCVEAAIVDEHVPDDCYTYRSAIGFGTAKVIDDRAAKLRALRAIAEKYEPGYKRTEGDEGTVVVVEVELNEITGKQRK